jgi:CubicO group peptidase (beta-lactamase class C family)
MSASKTTASLLVTMLADEGKIDLDKPVPSYVPELKGTAWDKITMKNATASEFGYRSLTS